MSERVKVQQYSDFRIRFMAADPEQPDSDLEQVSGLHQLTPYGMLLASLGSCTTIVLHTYARAHGIDLDEAEVYAEYQRSFREDCDECEGSERYEERIIERVALRGDLTDQDRTKLDKVVKFCSIRQMLESGIRIEEDHAGQGR